MADLNSYEEVTQLGEDLAYPDGYNVVEIIGTGDERTIRSFPMMTLSGPVSMTSNGVNVATLIVSITDPSATNPFHLDPITDEQVTPSSPQNLSTANWMTTKPRVFEDAAHLIEVPPAYIAYKENLIRILDGWTQSNPPVGWTGHGFHTPVAYVTYDGQRTLTVRDGEQTEDAWWEKTPAEIAKEKEDRDPAIDVTGIIYTDLAATLECDSGTIGIPNVNGQTVEVRFYYRPESGDSGIAYLNAEWNGGTVAWPINIIRGSWDGCTISLSPDPSAVKPVVGISVITATVSDRDGAPINNENFTFSVHDGQGNLSPISGRLEEHLDQEDEIISSSTTEFSTAHPIVKLNSITAIGGGFTWNNTAIVRGSSVRLQDQAFPLSQTPLKVNYDWGGEVTTEYTAVGTVDGDKVYISGTLGGGINGICSIDIDLNASVGEGISITADPTTIAKLGTSAITCICTNAAGVGISSGIKYTLIPNKGKLTMAAENTAIVAETASISDRKTCSVNYPIVSVSKVVFQTVEYTVDAFEGKEITITGDFGVVSGDALVDYVPGGISKGTYTAIDEDYDLSINAEYLASMDTCSIKVGAGDPIDTTDAELSVSASPESLEVKTESTIKAILMVGTTPAPNEDIYFSIASGFGTLKCGKEAVQTNASGEAETTLTANSSGTVKINASFGKKGASVSVKFTAVKKDEEEEKTLQLTPVYIVGWVDPISKKWELTNGAVVDNWGAADGADNFGCTDEDVPNMGWDGYLKIYNTKNDALAWDIVGPPSVTGGVLETSLNGGIGDSMEQISPFFYDALTIGIAWPMELNSNRQQKITIGDVDTPDAKVSGATVKISGQTSTTDATGQATFTDLPVGEHAIDITHPNYKDNRLGVPGGVGANDTDTKNDKYTVVDYSRRKFALSKIEVNISITYTVRWAQFYIGYGPGTQPL